MALDDLLKQIADSVAVNGMRGIGGVSDKQASAYTDMANRQWAGLLGSFVAQQYVNAQNAERQPTYQQGLLSTNPTNELANQTAAAEQNAQQTANQAVEQAAQITAPQGKEKTLSEKIGEAVLQNTTGRQIDTSLAPPNPFLVDNQRSVLLNKAIYEAAPEGEKGDALRKATSQNANLTREQLAAAGYDTKGLGALDATARDLAQKLDSDRARAILETTTPDGKYFRTADDYYRDSYYEHLALGYSPRQARKFAGNRAKEYQAERVGYLRAAYETYGHEGGVTNDYGVNWLGSMGQENPALANFYNALYPTPKDLVTRNNQLQDKFIDQSGQIAQLNLSHKQGFANRADQARLNAMQLLLQGDIEGALAILRHGLAEDSADNQLGRDKERIRFETDEDVYKYYKYRNIDLDYHKGTKEFDQALKKAEPDEVEKLYAQSLRLGKMFGCTDEELPKFAADHVFTQITGIKPGSSNKNSGNSAPKLSDIKGMIDTLDKRIKDAREEIDFSTNTARQEEVKLWEAQRDQYQALWDTTAGFGNNPTFKAGSENEKENVALADAIRKSLEGRYTSEQISKMIHDQVIKDTGDKTLAQQLSGTGMH